MHLQIPVITIDGKSIDASIPMDLVVRIVYRNIVFVINYFAIGE